MRLPTKPWKRLAAVLFATALVAAACGRDDSSSSSDDDSGSDEFTEEGFQNTTGKLYQAAARLFGNQKPVVGAIQGAAIGGGLGLSLVPDFRVASPEARFGANFVKLGKVRGILLLGVIWGLWHLPIQPLAIG